MMGGDVVDINGSCMERDFFEQNLAEARALHWQSVLIHQAGEHQHCIICTIAIPELNGNRFFKSGHHYLCVYCYDHYLNKTNS